MAQDKMLKFLVEGLTRAFDKQEDCDVMFSVDGQTIGAHRLILNIHSQVLYEMAAGWTPDKDPIAIDDMSFDSFKALLRYMYSSEVRLSNDTVFILLSASTHYKMNLLEEICVDHITKSLGPETVCMFMNEALHFKSRGLQEKCLELFSKETAKIPKEFFKRLSPPALSVFLDVDQTNILEVALFHRVKLWMEQQCRDQGLPVNGTNMRQVIGYVLYKIRFPTMTVQDFANSVTTIKGFLTKDEIADVFQKITVFDNKDTECPFPDKFRCQVSEFGPPFVDMAEVCAQKVLFQGVGNEHCDVKSLLSSMKDFPDGEFIGRSVVSLRIVSQCFADLANSSALLTLTDYENQDIRKELNKDFLLWEETADSKNVCNTMSKYMELRTKLNKLCKWQF